MIRALYSLAMLGAQPFLRLKLSRRGKAEPGYLVAVGERFGRYSSDAQPGAVWIHAVSLGESRAAGVLIDRLRSEQPGVRILLTHGTATGRAEGARHVREGDMQAWLPWDTPGAVRRFLEHFRPSVGVLMETEMWPNLAAQCRARGIPLALANARLSEQSLQGTLRLAWLSRPAYASLAAVWAQTEADAQRLAQAGATVKGVFGNMKFDATPDNRQLEQGRHWRRFVDGPIVMFASSREGEEMQLLQILKETQSITIPGWSRGEMDRLLERVRWLIVPRHPQRFDEVAELARAEGFPVVRRSQFAEMPERAPVRPTIWIGDSVGEMAYYYGMADSAMLGGSFEELGGQNLIEAAACGCPLVMGPHTFNFAEAAELAEQAGCAFRARDMPHAVQRALEIGTDDVMHPRASRAGEAFAKAHRGAALKTAQAVLALAAR